MRLLHFQRYKVVMRLRKHCHGNVVALYFRQHVQGCYCSVTRLSQGWHNFKSKAITSCWKGCNNFVSRLWQPSFTTLLPGCVNAVTAWFFWYGNPLRIYSWKSDIRLLQGYTERQLVNVEMCVVFWCKNLYRVEPLQIDKWNIIIL